MELIETSIFTRRLLGLMDDDEYRVLQAALLNRPGLGDVIPGAGGLRKLRWGAKGRGKRGGARVIYYHAKKEEQLLMLYIFSKNERDDLSASEKKALRRVVEEEYP